MTNVLSQRESCSYPPVPSDSINHDLASRVAQERTQNRRVRVGSAHADLLYMDAALVNGRDGAIRCSICINIYLASLRRALREMEARLPSSPTCLPVPRSRYAGFPGEDVPLVLRTGLPFELQTVSFPASSLPLRPPHSLALSLSLASRSPYPLPSYSQVVLPRARVLAPARSIGRHNKKSKRQKILYARSTGELHLNECGAIFCIPLLCS